MELNARELELAAISISIAAGCIPCTRYHISEAQQQGADSGAIAQAVHTGAAVADAALMQVWRLFDKEVSQECSTDEVIDDTRQSLLCAVGSAVARNNVKQLQSFTKAAQSNGIVDSEIMEIVGLAERIKDKAASHLAPIIDRLDADRGIAQKVAELCT